MAQLTRRQALAGAAGTWGHMARDPRARLTAVCDLFPDRIDKAMTDIPGAAGARARKHIYCEKPAGADVAGVKRMLRAAAKADPSKTISAASSSATVPNTRRREKFCARARSGHSPK
ncbi:MAG: hypothetical protein ABSF64_07500 [Bryobacteraceae bacterium]